MHIKPKKRLGQNFLVDKNIQKKIASACNLSKNDTVLEIGPGTGEITALLLNQSKKVIAVEIDGRLCEILNRKFSQYPNFQLLNQDILTVNILEIAKKKKLKIIANLPYYISTPIITHLLNNRKAIEGIYITIQKELGLRILSAPKSKSYSAFSCFVQYYTRPQILFTIKNSSFWPKPKVDSCFIKLKILSRPTVTVKDERFFFTVIRGAFNQRRKTLKNSLEKILTRDKSINFLKALKIDPNSRAEDLSLQNFADLANGTSHPAKMRGDI